MARKIKVFASAANDIESGKDYYEGQSKGLGKQFVSAINSGIKAIQKSPYSASVAYDTIRYKNVRRFPYVIFYQFDDKFVFVLRVFNTYREPLF